MREIRRLTDYDLVAAQAVRSAAYGQPDDLEAGNERFRPLLEHTLGAFDRGRLVSVATMLPSQAYLSGRLEPFGALAGVATAPEARRRGHVAALIRAWFEELREAGVGFSGEFPFDIAYYTRFGYQTVHRGRLLEVPIERFAEHLEAIGHGGRRADAQAVDHFDDRVIETFEGFVPRYDFSLARSHGPPLDNWVRALTPHWEPADRYTYLVDGGYLSVHLGAENVMAVRDYAWLHAEARADVLAFIAAMAGNFEKAKLFVPPGEPLLAEWEDAYAVKHSVYQLRILDLERALSPFRAEVERRFNLRLTDGQCPWNDGVFEVTLSPEGSYVKRAAAGTVSADVSLGQRALVSLLCDSVTPEALLLAGLAEGDLGTLTALSRLRGGRAIYLPEADGY